MNCEYTDWSEWGKCDQTCGGGSQNRTREVTRHAWYGGTKCSEDDSKEKRTCNEAVCPGKILLLILVTVKIIKNIDFMHICAVESLFAI